LMYRGTCDSWIDTLNTTGEGEGLPSPPPSQAVHSISIFNHPAILLEFDSPESKVLCTDLCNGNPQLLYEISPKAWICPSAYMVIFHFVPCNGEFNPSDSAHLHNIECDNDLPANLINAVLWCKHPDKHTPNQATATLKVACSTPNSPNRLLTGHI
jgi:hypothetical protein